MLKSALYQNRYYGMTKRNTAPPTKPTTDAKITHIFTNMSQIFSGKKTKKVTDLLEILKDHEDPENWVSRRSGNVPVLLLDATNSYVVVGRTILTTVEISKLDEALLAFLGAFYLLDFDYPKSHEIGLSVLQCLILLDKETPADLLKTVESVMA
ncbi:uncharacterized protein LOC117123570 [Anneissia japonica]|uniref:uncharacterized protein LOC117123570 n=1 Tax=Anneissia japonica TaxID=1529436 RepID=UPI00142572CA|nr:uncharacterized protein LOC117123570 [Anneissia japonica]